MAIAACFVFQREISRSVFWDFFDSIGQTRTLLLGTARPRTPGGFEGVGSRGDDVLAAVGLDAND
jgi:hypothetical protein